MDSCPDTNWNSCKDGDLLHLCLCWVLQLRPLARLWKLLSLGQIPDWAGTERPLAQRPNKEDEVTSLSPYLLPSPSCNAPQYETWSYWPILLFNCIFKLSGTCLLSCIPNTNTHSLLNNPLDFVFFAISAFGTQTTFLSSSNEPSSVSQHKWFWNS